jgi:hypothetical protein
MSLRSPSENSRTSSRQRCTCDCSPAQRRLLPWSSIPYNVSPRGAAASMDRVCLTRTACAFRFSQPLDAFIRPTLAGLVSCRIRSWGSPFRAFLLLCSLGTVSGARALLPFNTPPNLPESQPRRERRGAAPQPSLILERPWNAPRLQGFAPHKSPPRQTGCLDRHARVALLGFLPFRAFPPGQNGHGLHRASPHEVAPPGDESTFGPLFRVLLPPEVGLSLARLPALLGFTTF